MKLCEKIDDKLIFFEDLTKEEKDQIQAHLNECMNCSEKLQDFQNILSAIKINQEQHPIEDDLLTRYSIYLAVPGEVDYDSKKLTRAEIGRIRKHVSQCQACEEKIGQFTREYREIEKHIDETDLPELTLGPRPAMATLSDLLQQSYDSAMQGIRDLVYIPMPKYSVALGAVAALFIMIWVGPFFRSSENPYLGLVSTDEENASFVTRGGLPQTLAEGFTAFNAGDMEQAIQRLESFVGNTPNDPSRYYAHYMLGIAYLNQAKGDFLGRFQQVKAESVEAGIKNLDLAISLSQNSSVTEGCKWYIGMALLMKRDPNRAKTTFESIVDLRGRRSKKAKEMVEEIERLIQSQ